MRAPLYRPLTTREEQVVALLADGASYREAGERLGLSPYTVQTHAVRAGLKIPGTLPLRLRLVTWYREASSDCTEPPPPAGESVTQ